MVTRLRYQLYQNKEVCLKLPSAQFMYTVLLNILYVSYQMLFYCSVNNTIIIYYNFSVFPPNTFVSSIESGKVVQYPNRQNGKVEGYKIF